MALPKPFDAPIWEMPTLVRRFWNTVECISDDVSCWMWKGRTCDRGYGVFSTHRKHRKAHRIAWSLANHRPVPNGLVVCHACDTPGCVRPGHLFVGTYQDNAIDRNRKGRRVYSTGEDNHRATTTVGQVRAIRELLKLGVMTRANIAREVGVTKSVVNDIAQGRSWLSVI